MTDITITLSRKDAAQVAERVRELHHNPGLHTVDLQDSSEPMAWLLERLAGALGQYGPGVRSVRQPRADRVPSHAKGAGQ